MIQAETIQFNSIQFNSNKLYLRNITVLLLLYHVSEYNTQRYNFLNMDTETQSTVVFFFVELTHTLTQPLRTAYKV